MMIMISGLILYFGSRFIHVDPILEHVWNNGLMYLHVYSVGRHGHVDLCKAISSIELTKFYINQTHNSIVVFAIFKIKKLRIILYGVLNLFKRMNLGS